MNLDKKKEYVAENELFGLRKMVYEDCENVVRWRNAVKANYVYREELTLEKEQDFYRNEIETGKMHILIICLKQEKNCPVGCAVFNEADEDGSVEYGLFIGEKTHRGLGVGRWVTYAATKYAFEELHIARIKARIFTDNIASQKSAEAGGLVKTGNVIDVVCSDGSTKQMFAYEMFPSKVK